MKIVSIFFKTFSCQSSKILTQCGNKKFINYFLVSEGDHEKVSKKEILLGRRKDKKDKKDKGYAALDGESSQEEDLDTK